MPGPKLKGAAKLAHIPVKIDYSLPVLPKPDWIRVKSSASNSKFYKIKAILRKHKLNTVCEDASCPNIGECFGSGTATFIIMGDKCTRRCPFCDVGSGIPDPLDENEPIELAKVVAELELNYVVITSVNRDDLKDGGAMHFVKCIQEIKKNSPGTKIEILTPDFRKRAALAIDIFADGLPEVFNHNIETVSRLYKKVRPGAQFIPSLELLYNFKKKYPKTYTKTGLMVGVGETDEEVFELINIIRSYDIDMLTIGQYMRPSMSHLRVERYVPPAVFKSYQDYALSIGFKTAFCGPLVRSSYHAGTENCI